MKTAVRRFKPQVTFLGLAMLVNVIACLAVRNVTDPSRHRLAVFGASLDMTVTVAALYYWLVVRPGLRAKTSLIFIALMGLLRASFAFPDVIPGKALIVAGAECALLAAIVLGFRRARNLKSAQPESDPVARIRAILNGIIPFSTAERVLGGELSVLYYLFAWRAKPHIPAGSTPFTLYKRSGLHELILMVGLVSLLEVVPVHLLASRRSVMAAWVLTAFSLYGMLWAVALFRSFALRPTLVSDSEILLRFGLLFSLRVPVESIRSIGVVPVPGAVQVPRNTPGRLFIEFTEPLRAEKILGFTSTVSAIALSTDDDKAFDDALRTALPRLFNAVPNIDQLP